TAGAEAAVAGQPGETVAIKVLKEELASDPSKHRNRAVIAGVRRHPGTSPTHPPVVRNGA
ncbi:hypothetical protein ACWGCW_32025, partial [Streptomyces sp. NPDC054933]